MAQTKITGLSRMNVLALNEVFRSRVESGEITLGKTFAMFDMAAWSAHELVTNAINHLPGKRHPKASLWAIQRRLAALIREEDANYEAKVKEEATEETEPVETDVSVPIRRDGKIDPAALFLVDLAPGNMFEERRSSTGMLSGYECKLCTELVPKAQHDSHHAAHRRDRSQYATEQIRARKERNDMAAKKTTVTPKSQGIPAVYLNEDGSKFVPGKDASLKRDLIAAIDGLDNPNALHTFTEQEAAKILAARDWNDWLVKSRKGREAKAARAKAKAETRKAKVKDEVAAKREAKAETTTTDAAVEVQPDPKPAPRQRGRGRKVGS